MNPVRACRRSLPHPGLWACALVLFVLCKSAAQEREHATIIRVSAQLPVAQQPVPEKVSLTTSPKALPISLDTVFRLAPDQNGKIAIARQRLAEAFTQQDLAAKRWLPDLFVGTGFQRHEGGIQDFNGQFIHSSYGSLFAGLELRGKLDLRDAAFQRIDAARQMWQSKGELSKLTSETLLDAAGTYVDLLAARAGEAIGRDLEKDLADLLGLAQTLAKIDPGLRVEVTRIDTEIQAQKLFSRKLREGAAAAAAKLVFLLGLDPESELVPVDRGLVPFTLVDLSRPAGRLVEDALSQGPGVRELEGLLNLIEDARAKSHGPGRFLPSLEVTMAEGAFGAGPGSQSTWDNRWDLGLHLRWNLTEALTARDRRRLAETKIQQARLGYQDLRARLTLGVYEAREAGQSGRDQVNLGEKQIRDAEETYRLSLVRLKQQVKGASPGEVLMSLRALAGARLNYLNALRDLDKAQLRLFVLVGGQFFPNGD